MAISRLAPGNHQSKQASAGRTAEGTQSVPGRFEPLNSDQISFYAAAGTGCSHFEPTFTFSPISTSRRIASERPGFSSCFSAHWSTAARISAESLAFGAKVSGLGAGFCNSEELFDFRANCVGSGPHLLMRFLRVLA